MKRLLAAAACAALFAGCATNGSSSIPSTTQANLNANVLQAAVGTANIGQDGTVGLNVVSTLRQPNGLSGLLADLPTITGPAGFTVPAGYPGQYAGANVDAGTNHISGSPQVPRTNTGLVNTTLGTFDGVYAYGIGPYNCDQSCSSITGFWPGNPNNSVGNGFTSSLMSCSSVMCQTQPIGDETFVQPLFSAAGNSNNGFPYTVAAPIVPFFQNGAFPSNFVGYSPGFATFEVTPVSGQYTLSVLAPAQNTTPVTYTANATLNAATVLPPITLGPTTDAANGGLTGTVNVPAGVTETEVFIDVIHTDPNTGAHTQYFYTVGAAGGGPIVGTGTQAWTLPGNLGPCIGVGCQNGANATPSMLTGDVYYIDAVGYDYPAFEAGPPANTQQKPTIVGANGQADLTMSPYQQGTY